MKLLGKPRAITRDKRWRLDCDYLDKLAPAEREYMERFLLEYYLGNGLASTVRLHRTKKHLRLLYVAHTTTNKNDIVTASSEDVARANAAAQDANVRRRGTYRQADYMQAEGNPEDALIGSLFKEEKE